MRFYLDNCCLNRPFDDQTQYRIHLESEAVILILHAVEESKHQLISSDILRLENSRNPYTERREVIDAILDRCLVEIRINDKLIERCQELMQMNFPVYDAFHLACAEAAGVDVFFTTDDRLLGQSRRNQQSIRVAVENPLRWLSENIL
jgi:predicted nucleic acid-binding protein